LLLLVLFIIQPKFEVDAKAEANVLLGSLFGATEVAVENILTCLLLVLLIFLLLLSLLWRSLRWLNLAFFIQPLLTVGYRYNDVFGKQHLHPYNGPHRYNGPIYVVNQSFGQQARHRYIGEYRYIGH
jgi:hypothetical protein